MHDNEKLGWQEFHAKKKEGDKKCLSCHKEFTKAGYPNKESWLCDVFCWNMWQTVKSQDIPMDTLSRVYLLELKSIEFRHLVPDTYFDDSEETPSKKELDKLFEFDTSKRILNSGRFDDLNITNHPVHYNVGSIEVIDIIDDWKLGFYEGNIVKYTMRAKYKGKELQDLKKAKWYLDRLIKEIETK